jgi:hypothetical protein
MLRADRSPGGLTECCELSGIGTCYGLIAVQGVLLSVVSCQV